jgi:oxalate decarboxylase/phosphoglucose isomerase-like protein (cupin superfamily)
MKSLTVIIATILVMKIIGMTQALEVPLTKKEFLAQFNSSDFVYDLRGAINTGKGPSGTKKVLTRANMQALTGEGLSMGLLTLEPCGINLPHHHLRSSEMIYVIEGSFLRSGLTEENGGRTFVHDIKAGEVTFYPQGLVHYQQNLGCDTVTFLAAFSHDDPGFFDESLRLFTLPDEALASTFDRSEAFVKNLGKDLPIGIARGRNECLNRCIVKF